MPRKKIGEFLVESGLLNESNLRIALGEQKRWGGQLGKVLVQMHMITETELVSALGEQLNFPIVDLTQTDIDTDVLSLIPVELAQRHTLLPFARDNKFLDVAMSDPTDLGIIDELRIRTQLNIRWYLAGPKTISDAIDANYHLRSDSGVVGPYPESVTSVDTDPGDSDPSETTNVFSRTQERTAEIRVLQQRVSELEAYVRRDQGILRKLLKLLVEKRLISRSEILERLQSSAE